MADKTSRSKPSGHSRFKRARAQQLGEQGYISCTTALAAAAEKLDKKDPEVALMFCWLARDLLAKSEVYVRRSVPANGLIERL